MTDKSEERRQKMEYRIDDQQLNAAAFIGFANQVWPGKYDEGRTAEDRH